MAMFSDEERTRFCKALEQFAQQGDEGAWEVAATILNQAASALEQIVRGRYPNLPAAEVEDVVRDTVCRAIEQERLRQLWEQYEHEAGPGIYLCVVLRGRVSEAFRRLAARREVPLNPEMEPEEDQEWDIPAPCQFAPALDDDVRTQLFQIIRQCLNNDLDWQILYLRAVEELDFTQVARLLCISHDNARQRFNYLLENLRNCPELVQFCQQNALI